MASIHQLVTDRAPQRSRPGRVLGLTSVLVLALSLSASAAAFVLLQEKAAKDEEIALKERAAQSTARFDTFARQIEAVMVSGAVVAETTDGDLEAFRRTVEQRLAASFLSSILLLQLDETPVELAKVGSGNPALFGDLDAGAIGRLDRLSAAGELGLVAVGSFRGTRVLGFAASPRPGSRYAVYGELLLSEVVGPGSESDGLLYAFYLDGEAPGSLIASNTRELPLGGRRVTERARIGSERPLLVFAADGSLAGGFSSSLPWLVLVGGLFWSLTLTVLIEATRRGRDSALRVAGDLARQNVALDESQAELLRAQARLEHAHEETIRRLALAAEMRDDETGAHIQRVSTYAELLARRSGLDSERCEVIRLAAPLHDVGKISIPDSVLLKPGRHTDEERQIMQSHADAGRQILAGSNAELLDLAAKLAWTHHERFDGKGYPRGLQGEAIPLEGRILCIADVFDAITSERPYQKARSIEQAAEILREERGAQFDPRLVDLFLGALPELRGVKESFGSDEGVDSIAA